MIDWKRVAELQEEIGADGFSEVAEMFLEEAEDAVRSLAAGPSASEVEGQLHFLKGSALNLGLADLASLCQEGERKAAAGRVEEIDLNAVAVSYAASKAILVKGLASAAA